METPNRPAQPCFQLLCVHLLWLVARDCKGVVATQGCARTDGSWSSPDSTSVFLVQSCYVHRVLDMESGVFLDTESMEVLDTSSGLWLWPAFGPGFG